MKGSRVRPARLAAARHPPSSTAKSQSGLCCVLCPWRAAGAVAASALILHPMARSSSFPARLRQRLLAYRWRRVGVLAGSSLAFSLLLVLYLFGTGDHFFGRLFTAFFVSFCLLAATFLAILPFIGWASAHWFGRGWEAETLPAKRATKPTPGRPVAAASARRPPSSLA